MSRPFKLSTTYYRRVKETSGQFHADVPNNQSPKASQDAEHAEFVEEFTERPLSSPDESGQEDQEDEIENENQFEEKLRVWAVSNKIPHNSLKELLGILKMVPPLNYLPKDPRTLLQTPRDVVVVPMGQGQYWYNSIETCLTPWFCDITENERISLQFHIDGLPTSRSSKAQMWPILFKIMEKPWIPPQSVAIYSGSEKPESLQDFLSPFVKELLHILRNGLKMNSCKLDVQIHNFMGDSPARSYMKGVVYYNHHSGCTKCKTEGEFFYEAGRHMSFYDIRAQKRTDAEFRAKADEEHHKETTPLELLPIDMIAHFPIADSLHLIDLGIMRKLLYGWTHGSFNFHTKWRASQIKYISQQLRDSNSWMPIEIHRKVRGLEQLSYWKGTEYRDFLFYLGPVILKDNVEEKVYHHFLLLFCTVTIFSSAYYEKYYMVAEKMASGFVEMYIDIYGIDSIGSNVHNLIHVIDDVLLYGPLTSFSSYPFESYLHQLKRLIRTGQKPLEQVAKRIGEMAKLEVKKVEPSDGIRLKHQLDQNHTIANCHGCYNIIQVNNEFTLKNNESNKWFMTQDHEIVAMINATRNNGNVQIYGQEVVGDRRDFFDFPVKSSTFHIHAIPNLYYGEKKLYTVSMIKCKLIRLKYHNENVFVPLLHTLK